MTSMTAFSHVLFVFLCRPRETMYLLDYLNPIRQLKSSDKLRTNMELKLIKNLWLWHIAQATFFHMEKDIRTRRSPVSRSVLIVTDLATGSQDVGQKGVELKGKVHVKSENSRKRRMITMTGRMGRTKPIKLFKTSPTTNLMLPIWLALRRDLSILVNIGFSMAVLLFTYAMTETIL